MADPTDAKGFEEALLRANATPDNIAVELADVLRDLMRAVAANDSGGGVYRAATRMSRAMELIEHCPERLSWSRLLKDAVEDIRDAGRIDELDEPVIWAARAGLRYLVEQSCDDNAARGRASQRETAFLDEIAAIERRRDAVIRRRRR
jgi:hypothetical protein